MKKIEIIRLVSVLVLAMSISLIHAQFTEIPVNISNPLQANRIWGTEFLDFDNDDDLDFVFNASYHNYYDACNYEYNRICLNNLGNGFSTLNLDIPQSLPQTGNFSQTMSIEWGDYDNDGDLDVSWFGLRSGFFNTTIHRNDGNNQFTLISGNVSNVGAIKKWCDFDNDGDLDILQISENGSDNSIIYCNNGNDIFTPAYNGILTCETSSVLTSDLDNDGLVDLVVCGFKWIISGTLQAYTRVYRNLGSFNFTVVPTSITNVYNGSIMEGDYDSDSDMDIAIAGYSSNHQLITKIYRNDGDFQFTDIAVSFEISGSGRDSMKWGDYDNDGDLDLLFGGSSQNPIIPPKLYENMGYDTFQNTQIPFSNSNETLLFADHDKDGDLDVWLNYYSASMSHFRNDTIVQNLPPSPPMIELDFSTGLLTFATAFDDTTPVLGLSYDLRIGSEPGSCDIHHPESNPVNGFRRRPKFGVRSYQLAWPPTDTLYIAAQAIDNAFAGSEFGQELLITPIPLARLQSADQLEFGVSDIGYTTSQQSIEIMNWGTAPLTITNIITVNSVSSFSILNSEPMTLQPNSSYSIIILFSPLMNGSIADELIIFCSALDNPILTVSLHGTGHYAPLSVVQDLFASISSGGLILSWSPTTTNIYGTNQSPDGYVVLSSRNPNLPIDDYSFVSFTSATSYNHAGVAYFNKRMFYVVKAVIIERSSDNYLINNDKIKWENIKWREVKNFFRE